MAFHLFNVLQMGIMYISPPSPVVVLPTLCPVELVEILLLEADMHNFHNLNSNYFTHMYVVRLREWFCQVSTDNRLEKQ
jgi:hypothetical protein